MISSHLKFCILAHHKHTDKTDQELLESFYNDRNNEWLGVLLNRYSLLLFGLCMKYLRNEEDAKDAVQQVFIKVIQELSKYKVEYFKSWLYMVGKNHCLMQLRQKKHLHLEIKESLIAADDITDISAFLLKDQDLDLLKLAIVELKNEQKICIELFYLQQKSYEEISTHTGFSMLQVKSFIQNGKRNLKIIILKLQKNV